MSNQATASANHATNPREFPMTSQESFKKRIRTRMAKTGEKYAAARRALLTDPNPTDPTGSAWVSQPPHSEQAIQEGTGRSWNQWVAAIDAGPGRGASHTEIAAWVNANSDVGGWWAQGVTVGYERITGMRLPGQMPDGTFTAARSRTLAISPDALRTLVEDDDSRAALLSDVLATRVSKAGVKAPRFRLTDRADGADLGMLQFTFDGAATKTKFTVTHEKLPNIQGVEAWKEFWTQWLDALESEISAAT